MVGINVNCMYVYGMFILGVFVGLVGVNQVQGVIIIGFSVGIDFGIGFSVIMVVLFGCLCLWGVFGVGILFGVFQVGGYIMQVVQNVLVDIVFVVQLVIVFFFVVFLFVCMIFYLFMFGFSLKLKKLVFVLEFEFILKEVVVK